MSAMTLDVQKKYSDHYDGNASTSTLSHNASMDVFAEYLSFRGTGIVCTIGPACNSVETLKLMIKAGMNIARFNFSHGDYAFHKTMMDNVQEAASQVCKIHPVALALDTKGPEIRTGLNKDNAQITMVKGAKITITTEDAFSKSSTSEKLYLDYKSLARSVNVGQIILIADGSLVLEVSKIHGSDVICDVISGCTFGSRKNVCLPGVKVDLPTLSEKDVEDIKFGMEQKVDMIFASFIRTGENVRQLRELLNTTEHGKRIKIISKIENFEGVKNIDEIIELSDGIMAARGDLGMDISIERVITAQKLMAAKCNLMNKPLICATQMLESMINNFRPTRAEVADVVNAVLDGSDAVMLSGETANGKYPVEAIKVMHSGCAAAERMMCTRKLSEEIQNCYSIMNEEQTSAMAAVNASYKVRADAIIVLSTTGKTAQLVSQFHPRCEIIMVTRDEIVARQCHLYRGICSLYYPYLRKENWSEDLEARYQFALQYAVDKGYCQVGSTVIFVCGRKCGSGSSNSMRIESVGSQYAVSKKF